MTLGFQGIIRNIQLNTVDLGQPDKRVGSTSCHTAGLEAGAELEAGVFVHDEGGYLIPCE